MAKKSTKDLLIDLLILLFVVACTLIILRTLFRNVRLEIWIRDTIGMHSATLRATSRNRVSLPKTRFLPRFLTRVGGGCDTCLEETTCQPA